MLLKVPQKDLSTAPNGVQNEGVLCHRNWFRDLDLPVCDGEEWGGGGEGVAWKQVAYRYVPSCISRKGSEHR